MEHWDVPAGQPLHAVVTAATGPWSHDRRYVLDLHTPAADVRLVFRDARALDTLQRAVAALRRDAAGLATADDQIVTHSFASRRPR